MSNTENSMLSSYNSLLDKNLSGYFANTRMRKHLTKSGLIDREGRITSENTYRMKMAKKEHRDNVRDLLASAIVDKALDMERMRRYEIRKRLEELYKIELVQKVRSDRGKRVNDDLVALLTPRKKSGKQRKAKSAAVTKTEKRETKLPNIHYSEASKKSYYDDAESSAGNSIGSLPSATQPLLQSEKKKPSSALHPHPPPGRSKKKKRNVHRGLMLAKSDQMIAHRVQLQSMAEVTMKYLGSPLNLTNDMFPTNKLAEIQIIQQHCGASTICVFRELLPANTLFTFVSRRHRGSPFGLTIYINGIQNIRISSCCEYKHRPGHKVGGKNSQFGLVAVQGAAPCYRCQIRLNLVDNNKSTEKDDQVSSSDEESAVKSYDIIVSRAGRHTDSRLERPVSASVMTQTLDDEKRQKDMDETNDYKDDEFEEDVQFTENHEKLSSDNERSSTLSSSSSSESESESESEDIKRNEGEEHSATDEHSSDKQDEEKDEEDEVKNESDVSSDSDASSSGSEHDSKNEVPSEKEKSSDIDESSSDAEKQKETKDHPIVSEDEKEVDSGEEEEKEKEEEIVYQKDEQSDDESTLSASSKSSESSSDNEKEKEDKQSLDVKSDKDGSDNESISSLKDNDDDDETSETDAVVSDKGSNSDTSYKEKNSDAEAADTSDESDNEIPHDDEIVVKKEEKISRESPGRDDEIDEDELEIRNEDEEDVNAEETDDADEQLDIQNDDEDGVSDSDGGRATSVISRESTMLTGNEDGNFDAVNKTIQFNEEVDVVTYAKIEGTSTEEETPRSDESEGEYESGSITGANVVLTDLGDAGEEGDASELVDKTDDLKINSDGGGKKDQDREYKEGSLTSFVDSWRNVKLENLHLTLDQTNEFISLMKEKKDEIVDLSLKNTVIDGGFEVIKDALKVLTNLIDLNLSSSNIGPDEVEHLIEVLLDGTPYIEKLILHDNPLDDEGTSILTVGLARLKYLRSLDLSKCHIGDDGADSIFEYLSENTTLHELRLSSNELNHEGWRYIASSLKVNKTLSSLIVDSNKIDDEGIRILCNGVLQNKTLETLDVRNNLIDDQGADALYEAIVKCSTLYDVSIMPGNLLSESVDGNLIKLMDMKIS